MTSPPARTRATAGPYRPTPVGREGKMLSRQEAAQARRWRDAGWPVRSIARHLRRSPTTIRAYLKGDRQPGKRASPPDTFLPFAGYSRRRFTDDPHLGTRTLFAEVTALGYPGSYQTFCRALQHHQVRQHACRPCRTPRPATPAAPAQSRQAGPLPIPVALIAGEVLASCLGRLAAANHITTDDLLTILPPWFNTKIGNHDDRSQHHMLTPALPGAILALATLTGKEPGRLGPGTPRPRRQIPARPRPGHNRLPQMPGHPRHLPAGAGPPAGLPPDLLTPRPVAQRRRPAPARPR